MNIDNGLEKEGLKEDLEMDVNGVLDCCREGNGQNRTAGCGDGYEWDKVWSTVAQETERA